MLPDCWKLRNSKELKQYSNEIQNIKENRYSKLYKAIAILFVYGYFIDPTHPDEVLKDELEFRGISQNQLAKEISVFYSVLNEILNAKRSLNTEYAMLIETALDLDAEPLLKMQTSYNLQMANRDNSFMEKINKVRKIAAVL